MKKPAKKRKAPAMAKTAHARHLSGAQAKQKPAKIDPVTEKRAKAYSDMESHVCDLARAASLAMAVFEDAELFLFAVGQLDAMTERFRARYYAAEFPPE